MAISAEIKILANMVFPYLETVKVDFAERDYDDTSYSRISPETFCVINIGFEDNRIVLPIEVKFSVNYEEKNLQILISRKDVYSDRIRRINRNIPYSWPTFITRFSPKITMAHIIDLEEFQKEFLKLLLESRDEIAAHIEQNKFKLKIPKTEKLVSDLLYESGVTEFFGEVEDVYLDKFEPIDFRKKGVMAQYLVELSDLKGVQDKTTRNEILSLLREEDSMRNKFSVIDVRLLPNSSVLINLQVNIDAI